MNAFAVDEQAVASLFVAPVSACIADAGMFSAPLYPEEEACIRKAIPARRREFSAGRAAARRALSEAGAGEACSVIANADRSPQWPANFNGSITHCEGFCSAVVARSFDAAGLGFDAEVAQSLESDLHHLVCRPNDLEHFCSLPHIDGVDWPKLAFSAKESFYKCYYPVAQSFLGFRDVSVVFHHVAKSMYSGTFSIVLENKSKPMPRHSSEFVGRWVVDDERVYTGVTLPLA
ncbi:4'-phosphopantetheinyl transferase superfamily protein [Oleiagrimonas citrea]|jgi:4'-phosphopantetheinyl transferase EntD|uniref:Enterobactin synthase component D n=1 Tax=Oleiagrimonas citrea TaxID=1665687 RepID=A0A846ZQH1_9GAMM|nr:4'-phosphopantetheinyl transferase superfamily protein [Oleiagrimonas citrea]NKZ40172.1 4'-phosphopantetheinyl transferase superfamily protein [Oleiagrimonas citrea]